MRVLRFTASAIVLGAVLAGAAWANPPQRTGDTFTYSDGMRVRATDPQGRAGTARNDGTISYVDGTRVSHDVTTGETRIAHPDGRTDVSNSHTPSRTGDTFTYSDGTQIRAIDPNGKAGTIGKDGIISYSDGTRASHDVGSGDTKFVGADGSVRLINPGTGTDKTFPPGSTGGNQNNGLGVPGTGQSNNNNQFGLGVGKDDKPGQAGAGTSGQIGGQTGSQNNNTGFNINAGVGKDKVGQSGAGQSGGQQNGQSANGQSAGGSRQNTSTQSSQNNNTQNNNNQNSSSSNTKPESKPAKETEKTEKAPKEKVDKTDKGRQIADNPSGIATGPNLKIGGLTTNPASDQSTGGGQLKLNSPNDLRNGPGGRGTGDVLPAGSFLKLPASTLVMNPARTGGGSVTVIDPHGGTR